MEGEAIWQRILNWIKKWLSRKTTINHIPAPRPKTEIIYLSTGEPIIVDAEDYEWLNQYVWYRRKDTRTGKIYASRNIAAGINISMHQMLLPDVKSVDHIDGDTQNNSKLNLRPATASQQAMNRMKKKGTTSKYKGVYWDSAYKKWKATIVVNGKRIHLGRFAVEEDAARAYDQAAREFFGPYATLNFPRSGERSAI